MSAPGPFNSNAAAFFGGVKSAWTSVFFLVLTGTYIGIGALAHDFGFASWWLALSTLLVWAAPAQVILISALGAGAPPIEVAIAVGLSAIRLFPMVVALLPLLRGPGTRLRDLLLPTHFTSVSMWVESLRLLPAMPRERRIAFCNGLSVGYQGTAVSVRLRRLLPRGRTAAAVRGRAAVSDADVVPDLDRAQCAANGGPAGAGARPRARPAADLLARRARPDVDRRRRRLARLRRSPLARGRRDERRLAELWPYLLLILVGFLPNEIWRVLGLVLARGLNEDSEIVVWSRAVATAILAGVIAKLILFSSRRAGRHSARRARWRGGLRISGFPGGEALGVRRRAGRRGGAAAGGFLFAH